MLSPLYIAIVLELAPVISSPAPVVDTGNNSSGNTFVAAIFVPSDFSGSGY